MSLLTHFYHHHFFRNKELNHFYLSVAIMSFGEALINIFVPIYFYKLGYPVYIIIFFYFLVSLSFVIFSYWGAKIVSKIGIKHAILWSTPFLILYYLGLKLLGGQPWLFFILPLLVSWRAILYNYGYHLNFITHSENKSRGMAISFIGILSIAVYILAPLIGGFIAYHSFALLYLIGSCVLILGTLPLFFTKDSYEKLSFTAGGIFREIFSRENRGMLISFSGYAVESIIGRVIWPIFLIIILITVQKTGLLITLSMVFSVIVFYIIGKITDKYDRIKLLRVGALFYTLGWIGRIFANSPLKIFIVDSYKNIAEKVLHVPWAAHSYDLFVKKGLFSIQKKHFRFIVAREVVFNLARVVVMPLLILIFFIGLNPFMLSFIIASVFSIGYVFLNRS